MLQTTTSGILTEETGPGPSTKPCDHIGWVFPTREHHVCHNCGEVINEVLLLSHIRPKKKISKPYMAIHHYSERLAQFTGTGPEIEDEFLLERLREYLQRPGLDPPKERFGPDSFSKAIKEIDETKCTDYSRKKYQERWVWLRHRLDIESLPNVPESLVEALRLRYEFVHWAFEYLLAHIDKFPPGMFRFKRSNVININFITLNSLKQEGYPKFYRFFSMVKGAKTNMNDLWTYWIAIKTIMKDKMKSAFRRNEHELYEIRWDKEDITEEEIKQSNFYVYIISALCSAPMTKVVKVFLTMTTSPKYLDIDPNRTMARKILGAESISDPKKALIAK